MGEPLGNWMYRGDEEGPGVLESILINLWAMAFHSCDRGHNLILG